MVFGVDRRPRVVAEHEQDGARDHSDEVFPFRLQKLYGEPALHKEWRQEFEEVDHASA